MTNTTTKTRWLTITALMGAFSSVLMMLDFPVPFMPSFIKFDFSDLPALISSFALGPLSGVCVCLIKNLINLTQSQTGGVGELSNFLLGCAFVVPAGVIYSLKKNKKTALIACAVGAVAMAVISVFTNYFIVYPVYTKFMPIDAIIAAYQEINPNVDGLLSCLLMFNMPFTFIKGACCSLVTAAVYKYISPVIKGTGKKGGKTVTE